MKRRGSQTSAAEIPRRARRTKISSAGNRLDPTEIWLATRRLGDEEHLEWTFPILASRMLSTRSTGEPLTGLDKMYEPIQTWEDILWVCWVNEQLSRSGIGPLWVMELGCDVFDSIFRTAGPITVPAAYEPFRGRHSMVILGLGSKGDLVVKNSWGERWGDGGDGSMPRDYFENFVDDLWLSRPSSIGCSSEMRSILIPHIAQRAPSLAEIDHEELLKAWFSRSKTTQKSVDVRGVTYTMRCCEVFSAVPSFDTIDVTDMVSSDQQIIARMHCAHHRRSRTTIVQELFVTKSHRRLGCGTRLFKTALNQAANHNSSKLEIWIHEADARKVNAGPLRFVGKLGLEWSSVSMRRRPKLVALTTMHLTA